jgi:hypothetical protein
MVRSRVLLSAIFATLGVALTGCAGPFSRGYYAGGYPYGNGYYCGEWSVWPGVSCVDIGPPERVYPRPADPRSRVCLDIAAKALGEKGGGLARHRQA